MTVTVSWVQKKRGDNHLPKFRPTDSDALATSERKIFDTFLTAVESIPEDFSLRFLFNTVNEGRATEELLEDLLPELDKIAAAIFAVYAIAAKDMATRVRNSINQRLQALGSDVRLRGLYETSKAIDYLTWEPFGLTGKPITTSAEQMLSRVRAGEELFRFDPTIPAVDLFNQQPDNMPGKVYARFRAGLIIDSITSDVQASIEAVVAEGFTAQQTFNTGRTVTGLTPQQTARSLFGILQEVSAVPITGADYAAKIVPHTNGLFPRWALAVDRSMNRYAENLAQTPRIEAKEIIRRTDKHGQRYGNKLRRARGRMIARTETAYAQNRGMLDTMVQAQSDGLVGPKTLKEWVTGPTDVCDICSPMGGQKASLRQSFNWGTGTGDYPPAHPNCRCYIEMIPDLSQGPTRVGSGTVSDPNRYIFDDGFQISV